MVFTEREGGGPPGRVVTTKKGVFERSPKKKTNLEGGGNVNSNPVRRFGGKEKPLRRTRGE